MIEVYKHWYGLSLDIMNAFFQTKTQYLQPDKFPDIWMSKSQNKNVWFR